MKKENKIIAIIVGLLIIIYFCFAFDWIVIGYNQTEVGQKWKKADNYLEKKKE